MNPIAIYPYKEDPEIRKMRVQAWFRAVSLASKLTPRELEKQFGEPKSNEKVKRSCVWDKYRRGEVVPRSGQRPDGALNLVDRVEAAYPGTAKWLNLALWRLLDGATLELSEIKKGYDNLPNVLRSAFVKPDQSASQNKFWRRSVDVKRVCEQLVCLGTIESLTALLLMLREAELVQNQNTYDICVRHCLELLGHLDVLALPVSSLGVLNIQDRR